VVPLLRVVCRQAGLRRVDWLNGNAKNGDQIDAISAISGMVAKLQQ
jgi:hypothetical protein